MYDLAHLYTIPTFYPLLVFSVLPITGIIKIAVSVQNIVLAIVKKKT